MTLYVPAMVALIRNTRLRYHARICMPAAVLIVGTLGGIADAVIHLLAYAMTEPGVDQAAMLEPMGFMQGPVLVMISPLIICFFAGGAWLSVELAKAHVVSTWNAWLWAAVPVVAGIRAALATWTDLISTRAVGIITIAVICAAEIWVAVTLRKPVPPRAIAVA